MGFWKKKKEKQGWEGWETKLISDAIKESWKTIGPMIKKSRREDFMRGFKFGLDFLKKSFISSLDDLNKNWPDIFYKGVIDQLSALIKELEKKALEINWTWPENKEKLSTEGEKNE